MSCLYFVVCFAQRLYLRNGCQKQHGWPDSVLLDFALAFYRLLLVFCLQYFLCHQVSWEGSSVFLRLLFMRVMHVDGLFSVDSNFAMEIGVDSKN